MLLTPIEIRDAISMALDSLRANKFRSFMTILGVLVGVSSVIALASAVNGLALAAEQEIDNFGSNIISVTKLPPDVDSDKITEEMRNRKPITENEAHVIRAECPTVTGVSPQNFIFVRGGNSIKYSNKKFDDPTVFGTWPDFLKVRNRELVAGRFLSETDQQFRAMTCVVGSDIAELLFEDVYKAVDREVRVNGERFTIVGVLEKLESNFGNDRENRVVAMPLSTFSKLYPWEEELWLLVQADSYKNIEKAKEEITSALRRFRKVPFGDPDNFALATQDTIREQADAITSGIYVAMLAITSVGLLVGGIGVMNIMLVSVTERTREIGVRKAIGAKKSNIILQFLTEATTLSLVGGAIGVLVGIAAGSGINSLFEFPLTVSMFWILVGLIVSVSVGLVSGIYPAVKAARLDPIDALRYE